MKQNGHRALVSVHNRSGYRREGTYKNNNNNHTEKEREKNGEKEISLLEFRVCYVLIRAGNIDAYCNKFSHDSFLK